METVGVRSTMFIYWNFFFYIYKYLGPDKPSLLTFVQSPQVSNRYLISYGNSTGEKNYPYLISSENFFFRNFYPNKADKRCLSFLSTIYQNFRMVFSYLKKWESLKKKTLIWENFHSFFYFGMGPDSFDFQHFKIINGKYKKKRKKEGKRFGHIWGPFSMP